MFEKLLRESQTIRTLLTFVEATNKLMDGLTQLTASIVKELERQGEMINSLTLLCEMIVKNDPRIQELIQAVQESKKKKEEGSN